jgi:uroporphyrinogen-III synthase
LVEKRIGEVKHTEANAKKLADYLVEYIDGTEVTYFCSDLRLDALPSILTENNINVHEIEAYQTKYSAIKIDDSVEGVMFYSPSTVQSYKQENNAEVIAFCIGETTAQEAKKHFKDIRIAKVPTIESVIELVNEHYV